MITKRALFPVPVIVTTSPSDFTGGIATETGRIMSISSWVRMWQWKTYSHP